MKSLVTSLTLLFAVSAISAGGNIGSSGKSNEFISIRCSSAVGVLMDAQERGNRLWRRSSNKKQMVVDYFEAKLNEANDKMGEVKSEYSLLKRSIERGLKILYALKTEGEIIDHDDQIRFLRGLYSFILQGVVYIDGTEVRRTPVVVLDRDHQRFRNESKRNAEGRWTCKSEARKDKEWSEANCRDDNEIRKWEQRFTEYIDLEIEWFLNTHTGKGYFSEPSASQSVRIIPFGSTKAFTVPGALMTGYLIEDFRDVLWSEAFACSKETLEGLGVDLTNYNNNAEGREEGPDIVQFAHSIFRSVQAQARSCVGLPQNYGAPR